MGCRGGGFCDVTSGLLALIPFLMLLPAAGIASDLPPVECGVNLLLSVFVLMPPDVALLFCCCEAAAAAAAFWLWHLLPVKIESS